MRRTVTDSSTRAAWSLSRVLLANLIVHALAMLAMAALLLPMMPGGGVSDVERIAQLAEHPWTFRIGWWPWHACAIADVWLAIVVVRSPLLPRGLGIIALLFTLIAVLLDQAGQILWVTGGLELARQAHASGELSTYLTFEAGVFDLTAVKGALGYTLATVFWVLAFDEGRLLDRRGRVISALVLAVMLTVTVGPMLPSPLTLPAPLIAPGNAIGFVLLLAWFWVLADAALLRTRDPNVTHPRDVRWRPPRRGLVSRVLELVANDRVVTALMEPLPAFAMKSRVRDVVYVNYLVPAERLVPLVPPGLTLDRLGHDGKWALFTFLTFGHRSFGLRMMGPLRRLMPDAVQSNWRIHVIDPQTQHRGIHFVTNAVDHLVFALGARMFAEAMPMHWLKRAEIARRGDALTLVLDPGDGSGPDVASELRPRADPAWEGPWAEAWSSRAAFLDYCVPQHRALSSQPWRARVTRQEIQLGVRCEDCVDYEGEVRSAAAERIAGDAERRIFVAPEVDFSFDAEHHDRRR